MLKQVTLAVCDICGATEEATPAIGPKGENIYYLPKDWSFAAGNRYVHLCPECTEKLTRQPLPGERRIRL